VSSEHNAPISVEEAARKKYGYEVLLREVSKFLQGFAGLGRSGADKKALERFIRRIGRSPFDDEAISKDFVRLLEQIKVDDLLEVWERWIELDSVWLHVLIPRFLAVMANPSPDLVRWVLKQGMHYPNPSFNRFFVQAAIRCIGLCDVLETILSEAEGADKDDLERIGSAFLWAYYDPEDLSGDPAADHDEDRERMLRRKIVGRFRLTSVSFRLWRALRLAHRRA